MAHWDRRLRLSRSKPSERDGQCAMDRMLRRRPHNYQAEIYPRWSVFARVSLCLLGSIHHNQHL